MKVLGRIILVIAALCAVGAAVSMCSRIFETKMTKYYKVS